MRSQNGPNYNKEFSVEANRKYFLKNQNKKEKKRGHEEEKTSNDRGAPRGGGGSGGGHGNTNSGRGGRANNTTAQGGATSSEAQSEQARFARELDTNGFDNAHLDAEEMSLVCRCDSGTIDLLLDTGTVSNLVPEDQRDVVQDIRNERTALLGVGGARVLATETGEAGVFGRSRIVPGSGAIEMTGHTTYMAALFLSLEARFTVAFGVFALDYLEHSLRLS